MATFKHVTTVEILGTSIAILGCILTSVDSNASKSNPEESDIVFGNVLCFFSSLFATMYIVKGLDLSRRLDALHYLVMVSMITTLIFLVFGPLIARNDFKYDMNEEHGFFGWMTPNNFIYSFFVVSLVNGCGSLSL
jgi:threonine/homoserine efflux transporter RhtA